jgi:hypothetical protein
MNSGFGAGFGWHLSLSQENDFWADDTRDKAGVLQPKSGLPADARWVVGSAFPGLILMFATYTTVAASNS